MLAIDDIEQAVETAVNNQFYEFGGCLDDMAREAQKQTDMLSEVISLLSTIAGYLDEIGSFGIPKQ